MTTEILVLSVSRQGEGLEVAGLQTSGGGWIRLLSTEDDGALRGRQYRMGGIWEPRIWDVVELEAPWPVTRRRGVEWRMSNHRPWRLLERPASARHAWLLQTHLDSGPELLGDCEIRLPGGGGPRDKTIALVRPDAAMVRTFWDSAAERRKLRMSFRLQSQVYDLPLVDEPLRRTLETVRDNAREVRMSPVPQDQDLLLAVRLGEPLRGWRYKLVSGVCPLSPAVARWRNLPAPLPAAAENVELPL